MSTTTCSSSSIAQPFTFQPPTWSITVMAKENSAFVWIWFVIAITPSTSHSQNSRSVPLSFVLVFEFCSGPYSSTVKSGSRECSLLCRGCMHTQSHHQVPVVLLSSFLLFSIEALCYRADTLFLKSRILVRRHAPATSGAMAVLTYQRDRHVADCRPVSLSTASTTMPHLLLPSSFLLKSQKPSHGFPCSSVFQAFHSNFRDSCSPKIRHVIGFSIMLSVHASHNHHFGGLGTPLWVLHHERTVFCISPTVSALFPHRVVSMFRRPGCPRTSARWCLPFLSTLFCQVDRLSVVIFFPCLLRHVPQFVVWVRPNVSSRSTRRRSLHF